MATAWEPYQELFQGVIVCLHSDFRIGGLKPGQVRKIRGKIYLMPADVTGLLARYRADFPEHQRRPTTGQANPRTRKLIEFGWDEPDLEFLLRNREMMKRSPFDGCVFHVNTSLPGTKPESLTWLGWSRREFHREDFPAARDALATQKIVTDSNCKAFDHNFLRFNVTPGDLDWFDDYRAVVANARLAGLFAQYARCDGILLDTEQYEGQLFDPSKQRDGKQRGWPAYALQARKRGREIMAAAQESYPGMTVMLTFGPSLLNLQTHGGIMPLEGCRYGLLVPFVDGLIEAAQGNARIVDGFEQSYGFREAARFQQARELITDKTAPLMANPPAYRRLVRPGFGLWLDFDWRKRGWNPQSPGSNYFSPDRFQDALLAALHWSDEYVWIYTEKPRFWAGDGKPVELPAAYVDCIWRARKEYCVN
jgi:hypothetical protein